MLRIGAHMSVAGGMALAVDRAVLHGCEALQVFARNPNRWRSRPLDPGDVREFRRRSEAAGITPRVSHGSYLINLATDLPVLRELSIGALLDELDRAQALGLHGVVVHPGVRTSGAERQALRLVADAIRTAFAMRPENTTAVLLEHTAGQGRALGCRFEHFADILDRLQTTERIGICLDTCHLAASGYDLVSEAGYDRTFAEFDRLIGLGLVRVFHANDSKRPCGSRVDRHEHIGKGCLGLEPFQRLLHDGRFSGLPMLIETAKSPAASRTGRVCLDPLDVENLNTLRRLRQRPALGTSLAIP